MKVIGIKMLLDLKGLTVPPIILLLSQSGLSFRAQERNFENYEMLDYLQSHPGHGSSSPANQQSQHCSGKNSPDVVFENNQ